MAYKVGETVVYPHHGAADIISKEKRTIKGEEREYNAIPVMKELNNMENVLVGFGFIGVGFFLSTRWR